MLDLLTCDEIIIHACRARLASSRHLDFFRLDYPVVDPPEWHRWVTLRLEDGDVKTGRLPIDFWGPLKQTYEEHNRDYKGWYGS